MRRQSLRPDRPDSHSNIAAVEDGRRTCTKTEHSNVEHFANRTGRVIESVAEIDRDAGLDAQGVLAKLSSNPVGLTPRSSPANSNAWFVPSSVKPGT
ncbi:MAG: hypothetical protein MI923_21320 [Phycisphaerales bacterium]|nr:hypothetical protein [Phycisphaerales bacterium]